jgi:hypothetical protein
MKVYRVVVPNDKLLGMPETERVLLVQLGHLCNELSFFNKLLVFASDLTARGMERYAMVTQSMIITRVFIGKIFEAWRMMERDFFGSRLSKELEPALSQNGKEALSKLKRYFGQSNLISTIRNTYSFHYDADNIEATLRTLPTDKPLEMFLGENYSNTLHYFCEEIVSTAMLSAASETEPQKAMDRIIGELVEVSGYLIDFTNHTMAAIFERHLGKSWEDFETEDIEVDTPFSLDGFKIPFFIHRGGEDGT